MRFACLLLVLGLLLTGCGGGTGSTESAPSVAGTPIAQEKETTSEVIVTPADSRAGTVAAVNLRQRYAVVRFPIGSMPPVDQQLNVYRNGLKVAELKITGPTRENNTVADVTAGQAQVGDEVREN